MPWYFWLLAVPNVIVTVLGFCVEQDMACSRGDILLMSRMYAFVYTSLVLFPPRVQGVLEWWPLLFVYPVMWGAISCVRAESEGEGVANWLVAIAVSALLVLGVALGPWKQTVKPAVSDIVLYALFTQNLILHLVVFHETARTNATLEQVFEMINADDENMDSAGTV